MDFIKKYNAYIYIAITFIAQWFFPWWIIFPISFVFGYFSPYGKGKTMAIYSGLMTSMWLAMLMFQDLQFDVPMSQILSDIFGGIGRNAVYSITSFLGGFIAGLGGFVGRYLKEIIARENQPIS